MTYKWLLPIALFCSLPCWSEQYLFTKGTNQFEVTETSNSYEVTCNRANGGMASKNKHILDRQLRIDALDVIGAYIIFKQDGTLPSGLFQVFTETINLHYNAYVENVKQENRTVKGVDVICYSCPKCDYKIECATYSAAPDIVALLEQNYANRKGEQSAALIYESNAFTSEQYISLERDFLVGDTKLPESIRNLLDISDRLEKSINERGDEVLKSNYKKLLSNESLSKPYLQFCLEEWVTSAPLKEKPGYYKKWIESIEELHTVWEDVLLFCSKISGPVPKGNFATFSEVIAAYPGAISPFGIRQPIDDELYNQAAKAYAASNFSEAVEVLLNSIDYEGISAKTLNLTGASYRFLENPEKAMPYLLLCFKLDPKTPYLVGNIMLCMEKLHFPAIDSLRSFLTTYVVDEWSRQALDK